MRFPPLRGFHEGEVSPSCGDGGVKGHRVSSLMTPPPAARAPPQRGSALGRGQVRQAVSSRAVMRYLNLSGSSESRKPALFSACGYIRKGIAGSVEPGSFTSCASLKATQFPPRAEQRLARGQDLGIGHGEIARRLLEHDLAHVGRIDRCPAAARQPDLGAAVLRLGDVLRARAQALKPNCEGTTRMP